MIGRRAKGRFLSAVPIALTALASPALPASRPAGLTLERFRNLPDRRIAIRTSLGFRSIRALDSRHLFLTFGFSAGDACKNPESYRIVSFDDPAYAYEKFVRPVRASLRKEIEAASPPGGPFPQFTRTTVTLEAPRPLKKGRTYSVIALGADGAVATGGRAAQSLTYPAASVPYDPRIDLATLGLRAVEPVGPRVLMLEFGPDFSVPAGSDPSNYRVAIDGQPVRILRLSRISRVDTYLPVGWPLPALPMHEICLEIDRPIRNGDRIEASANERVTLALGSASLRFDENAVYSPSIKVNQVGYPPDDPAKIGYLGRWMGAYPGGPPGEIPALRFDSSPDFYVCDAATKRVVYAGKARWIHAAGEKSEGYYRVDYSGENVYALNFSAFRRPGTYFLRVPRVGRSLPFRIGPDVYAQAFRVSASGLFMQRCGIALGPPYTEWRRIACHRKGILPTTQNRYEPHDLRDLPKKVDYRRVRAMKPDPAFDRLNRDPALFARWRLEGDWKDATGRGRDLKPAREGQAFSADSQVYPGDHRTFGPTPAGGPVGAALEDAAVPLTPGVTAGGWFRYDAGDRFDGRVFGLREDGAEGNWLQINAVWGVLRASGDRGDRVIDGGRVGDGRWHYLALVAETPKAGADSVLRFYIDGALKGTTTFRSPAAASRFVLGELSGPESGGKRYADFRLYRRALTPREIAVLSVRRGERAQILPIYGGHHDAGDYNPRSHLDVAQILMDAYEISPRKYFDGQLPIPERGDGIPDLLNEADWALRLWIGLQDTDGGVFDGTESNGDPNFYETVELDPLGDYAYAKDGAGSFAFAGAMAQAARIRKSLGKTHDAADFLRRAERAYDWAERHPPASGHPEAEPYRDNRAYAAAELLRDTGRKRYRDDFARSCVWSKEPDAEPEVYGKYDQTRAAWAYSRCPAGSADPKLLRATRDSIVRYVERFIGFNATMAYHFLMNPQSPISWGTGAQLHWAVPATWAYALTGEEKYRTWILRSCDNTLGANPLGLSFIVGLGTRTVRAPLHNSRYNPSGEVVAGMQAEGPNERAEGYNVAQTAYPEIRGDTASLYAFVDAHFAISMDEGLSRSQAEAVAVFGGLLPDHRAKPGARRRTARPKTGAVR
jgi:hypothetical protein